MEKYGFVYIWYDKKRKMYYIGCRWGNIDDGYICSSNRMRDAYRRRPKDFKRKILSTNIDNREMLLEEEFRWLSFIHENELGKKYYNLRKHKWGHWATDKNTRKSIGEKISSSPERSKNISRAMKGKKPHSKTTDAAIKALKGKTYEEIHGYEKANEIKEKQKLNRKPAVWTEESRKLAGERAKNHMKGRKLSEETKIKMSESQKKRHLMRKILNE